MARDLEKQLRKASRRLCDAGSLGREERNDIAALICRALEEMAVKGGRDE